MLEMKVLVAARMKAAGLSPFVTEQVASLVELGVGVDTMPISAGGVRGYAAFARQLRDVVRRQHFDLVHAHNGLSGLFATFQRAVPVVITFHGSDINQRRMRPLSRTAAGRAAASIVVSTRMAELSGFGKRPFVIPCGVDPSLFYPEDYAGARWKLGFGDESVVLFGGSRKRAVKNFPLAEAAVRSLGGNVRLVELDGASRSDVRTMLSAADVLLLTSHSEGSPQIVKEALLTGCPVVSTDVGDVADVLAGVPYCHIAESNSQSIAASLRTVLRDRMRVPQGRYSRNLTSAVAARRIVELYNVIVHGRVPEGCETMLSAVRESSVAE